MEPGSTIGLFAIGFPDSVAFLDCVAGALEAARPGLQLRRYDKGNASTPASADLLREVTGDCDAVIAAYGH